MNATLLCLSIMLTGPSSDSADSIVVDDLALVIIKKEVDVPAREAGVIDELQVELQDEVELGDAIAHLDRDLAEIELKAAAVDLDIAKKEAENIVDRLYALKTREVAGAARERSLQANREYPATVTVTELLKLELEEERARLSVEQADHTNAVNRLTEKLKLHTMEAAERRLARRDVLSPLKGMIVEIYKQSGEWVDPRDPIVRIVQLNELRVNGRVDSTKYGPELRGCKVDLDVVLPGGQRERYHGVVKFVNPELDAVNKQMEIQADVENHNGLLRPGMQGVLTIYVGTKAPL